MRQWGISSVLAGCMAISTAMASPGVEGLNLLQTNELQADFQPFELQTERSRGLSWFSTQRLTLSHSLSYGVFSGSYGTHSMGFWSSRVGYQISRPLSLNAEVGILMNPVGDEPLSLDSVFLKSFDLEYKPNKNFQMRLMYQGTPSGGYPGWSRPGILDTSRP